MPVLPTRSRVMIDLAVCTEPQMNTCRTPLAIAAEKYKRHGSGELVEAVKETMAECGRGDPKCPSMWS